MDPELPSSSQADDSSWECHTCSQCGWEQRKPRGNVVYYLCTLEGTFHTLLKPFLPPVFDTPGALLLEGECETASAQEVFGMRKQNTSLVFISTTD